MIQIMPNENPKNIWFRLCTPKYMRENGTTSPNSMTNAHAVCSFSNPIYFEIIGSNNGNATYECPLGLPKSVGQNHSYLLIYDETQIGRDCWYACLSIAMMWKPIRKKLKWMIAFIFDLAKPIWSKKITAITGVLQMMENMFIIISKAFDCNPSWIV